jgi:hypothetical protein
VTRVSNLPGDGLCLVTLPHHYFYTTSNSTKRQEARGKRQEARGNEWKEGSGNKQELSWSSKRRA